jgi:hypothetical protein
MTDDEKLALAFIAHRAVADTSEVIIVHAGVAYSGFITDIKGWVVDTIVRAFGTPAGSQRVKRSFDLREVDDMAEAEPVVEALDGSTDSGALQDVCDAILRRVRTARAQPPPSLAEELLNRPGKEGT